ncbi:MAG TPA: hypothetical protein VHY79_00555, partial [Rhizomicrobium sp.]|nr:hypothetical protein [Rhizomicrobium sp.]
MEISRFAGSPGKGFSMHDRLVTHADAAIPLDAVKKPDLEDWLKKQSGQDAKWVRSTGFAAKEGELLLVPAPDGGIGFAVLGLGDLPDPLAAAVFSESLPESTYVFRDVPEELAGARGVLAWLLGTYEFDRYRKRSRRFPLLLVPAQVDPADVQRI